MPQNLKNFLIAFATGLVVFGIGAVILFNVVTNELEESRNRTENEPATEQSEQQ